jgi:hypothetical protein
LNEMASKAETPARLGGEAGVPYVTACLEAQRVYQSALRL